MQVLKVTSNNNNKQQFYIVNQDLTHNAKVAVKARALKTKARA